MKTTIHHSARASLLLAFAALCGCPGNGDGDGEPAHDPEACAQFVVPTAMGLGWEKLNHRISTWSIRLERETCRAQTLQVTHIGGDYSTGDGAPTDDRPTLSYAYRTVRTDVERIGVARVSIEATVGPGGAETGDVRYVRSDLALRNYPHVVAIIEGVAFDTGTEQTEDYPADYDPAHGYTMRAFGARAEVTDVDEDELTLDWELVFDPAPSPDRPKLNAALEHARVAARLDVLLVGSADPNIVIAEHSYAQAHEPPTPLEDQEIPHADEETQSLEMGGGKDGEPGFYGFGSFRFDMKWEGCSRVDQCAGDVGANGGEQPGEYIRELSIGLTQADYSGGISTFLVDGYLSNASRFLANYPNVYDFRSTVVWVQGGEVGAEKTLNEAFETGTVNFDLE